VRTIRVAVIGAGAFGRNHVRIAGRLPGIELTGIFDTDHHRAQGLAEEHHTTAFTTLDEATAKVEAAIVATPTSTHEGIASHLLQAGVDVLVEKPVADSAAAGERLAKLAKENACVLQAGHLERFNPAVMALERAVTIPLFFEVHRLSVFTPRSLDVDVVLDLMIHDLDIVLNLTCEQPSEIRAAGISVLSANVDIANVRLAFPGGCVANLTASRVSTEKVRKLRLFQPNQYISLDYARQDALSFAVHPQAPGRPDIGFSSLPVEKAEPLQLELEAFFECVRTRSKPRVDGLQAAKALRVAEAILDNIKEHGDLVRETIRRRT
jgi:predicted dehydrogenase